MTQRSSGTNSVHKDFELDVIWLVQFASDPVCHLGLDHGWRVWRVRGSSREALKRRAAPNPGKGSL
jgi:hypothetical protein